MPILPADSSLKTSQPFQKRLALLLQDSELSVYEFCAAANVNKSVLNRALLYGIIPGTRSLVKLADALHVPLLYLLAQSDDSSFFAAERPACFSQRLRELMREKELRFSAVAKKMTFPESYFHDWIRTNTLPSPEYLLQIAAFFEVSPDYLLGRTDERN